MRQSDFDNKKILKCIYGLENYKLPQDIKTKAILFYATNEEKSLLEKNHIFYLEPDCSKNEIIDAFENKIKTEEFIAFHAVDFKLSFIISDLNINSIFIMVHPNSEKLFDIAQLNLNSGVYHFSPEEENRLHQMTIAKLIKYGSFALGKNVFVASLKEDLEINQKELKSIIETKYNIDNIFDEENNAISKMIENYARSKH